MTIAIERGHYLLFLDNAVKGTIYTAKASCSEFFNFVAKNVNKLQNKTSDAQNDKLKSAQEQALEIRIEKNKDIVDKLRHAGVTNEYFRDRARQILLSKIKCGNIDDGTQELLEKFIIRYSIRANMAFKEIERITKYNELDKKIEGCLKAYINARSAMLTARANNFKRYSSATNAIRKNLIELYQKKYPHMTKGNILSMIGAMQ